MRPEAESQNQYSFLRLHKQAGGLAALMVGVAKTETIAMTDEPRPDWQVRLANLRPQPRAPVPPQMVSGDLSSEALMTIVAIMKDNDDPKLQMAAAKMVLEKSAKLPSVVQPNVTVMNSSEAVPPTPDDIDAAIALAKIVLDELAGRKTQKLDGKGAVVTDGTARTDNAAG